MSTVLARSDGSSTTYLNTELSVIMDIYRRTMETPYNFLWLSKTAKNPNEIFHIGFNPGETIA